MRPLAGAARSVYHQLLPYDLRIKLWVWRRRLSLDPDKLPGAGVMPTERIAIQTIGRRALKHSAFAQAVLRHTAGLDMKHAMLRTWIEYPLQTNERGAAAVQAARPYHTIPGARSLDIGCAYGGTPIAFAQAGAEAYGLELDAGLLALARANLTDHPGLRCTLMTGDVLQPEVSRPLGQFDIITCDNVIEHVEKASALLDTIAGMLTTDGVAIIGIPNPFSSLEVLHDGHYALFGLTLLERDHAIDYFVAAGHTDAYGVGEYCFTLDDYRAMFRQAGLEMTLLDPMSFHAGEVESLRRRMAQLRAIFARQAREGTIPAVVQREIEAGLDRYLSGFDARYTAYRAAGDPTESARLGARLLIDYQQHQWQVLARRAGE